MFWHQLYGRACYSFKLLHLISKWPFLTTSLEPRSCVLASVSSVLSSFLTQLAAGSPPSEGRVHIACSNGHFSDLIHNAYVSYGVRKLLFGLYCYTAVKTEINPQVVGEEPKYTALLSYKTFLLDAVLRYQLAIASRHSYALPSLQSAGSF